MRGCWGQSLPSCRQAPGSARNFCFQDSLGLQDSPDGADLDPLTVPKCVERLGLHLFLMFFGVQLWLVVSQVSRARADPIHIHEVIVLSGFYMFFIMFNQVLPWSSTLATTSLPCQVQSLWLASLSSGVQGIARCPPISSINQYAIWSSNINPILIQSRIDIDDMDWKYQLDMILNISSISIQYPPISSNHDETIPIVIHSLHVPSFSLAVSSICAEHFQIPRGARHVHTAYADGSSIYQLFCYFWCCPGVQMVHKFDTPHVTAVVGSRW